MKLLDDLIVAIAHTVIRWVFALATGLVYVQFLSFVLVTLFALSLALYYVGRLIVPAFGG